jgi:hypothetical protein
MFFFNNTNDTNEENDGKKVGKVEYEKVEYGQVPFITFICVILSKLAYLPDCGFLPKYEQFFGQKKIGKITRHCNNGQPFIKLDNDIEYNPIPASIFKAIKDARIEDIFKDQKIFKKCQDITFYTDSASNEKFVDFIKYAEFFNILNGSTNKRKTKERLEGGGGSKNEYVQYISLAWSNYSMIYVVADKRCNTIFIVYRGTASFKGITSYVNFNTFNKNGPCDSDEAFIPGIFKITTEAIHTLLESVSYLATHFLKATTKNSVKVLVTGHSLGGAMASIFAYLYTGIRNSNNDQILENSLSVLNKQIVCISIGAPRCINDATLKRYNHFINQNLIMYRRLVTKGDPVPQMPHKAYFGYHHPGDKLKTKNGLVFCQSTYSGLYGNFIDYDKSSNCKSKEDAIDSVRYFISQHNQYDHLNYLYVSYLSLVPVGFSKNEIDREPESGDTVMRVVLGSNKYDTKVAFFNLVKSRGANYKKPLLKFLVDVHNQDILMTHKAFVKLISLMKPTNNDNIRITKILNEEIFDTDDEAPNLNCFTSNVKTRRLIRNKKGTRKKRD